MSALHTACETEVKIGGNRYCFDASIVERISVREEDARFCKTGSVEVAEKLVCRVSSGNPPLRCGDVAADVLGSHAQSQKSFFVDWSHMVGILLFTHTK